MRRDANHCESKAALSRRLPHKYDTKTEYNIPRKAVSTQAYRHAISIAREVVRGAGVRSSDGDGVHACSPIPGLALLRTSLLRVLPSTMCRLLLDISTRPRSPAGGHLSLTRSRRKALGPWFNGISVALVHLLFLEIMRWMSVPCREDVT